MDDHIKYSKVDTKTESKKRKERIDSRETTPERDINSEGKLGAVEESLAKKRKWNLDIMTSAAITSTQIEQGIYQQKNDREQSTSEDIKEFNTSLSSQERSFMSTSKLSSLGSFSSITSSQETDLLQQQKSTTEELKQVSQILQDQTAIASSPDQATFPSIVEQKKQQDITKPSTSATKPDTNLPKRPKRPQLPPLNISSDRSASESSSLATSNPSPFPETGTDTNLFKHRKGLGLSPLKISPDSSASKSASDIPSLPTSIANSFQERQAHEQMIYEQMISKVKPVIERPAEGSDLKNVEAFYRDKIQEHVENQEKFQRISDISNDLEAYYDAHHELEKPPQLKQFRDDFEDFKKNVKQAQITLMNDNITNGALSKIYQELCEKQSKLVLSREQYRAGALVKDMNMNWVDKEYQLAVGGNIKEITALELTGISFVVDARQEASDDEVLLRDHGIELLRMPIVEHREVEGKDFKKLEETVDQVKDRLSKGQYGLIHCREGRGRSVLIAACVLISQGMKKDAALKLIRDRRQSSALNLAQEIQIGEFAQKYGPKSQEKE